MKIAVIHGPNLRSLGKREPEVYGTDTLEDINDHLQKTANELGVEITAFQSNHEGELIDYFYSVTKPMSSKITDYLK